MYIASIKRLDRVFYIASIQISTEWLYIGSDEGMVRADHTATVIHINGGFHTASVKGTDKRGLCIQY